MSKKDKIAEVLNYHGYKVSNACIDALAAVKDDKPEAAWYDSWGDAYDADGNRIHDSWV